MGSITLLCGLPGCGKSTYLESLGNKKVVLCPDDFRLVLTGQEYYGPAEDSVWSHVKTAARVLVKSHDIVIDATHLTPGSRGQWTRIAKQIQVPINCIYFNIPYEVCLERNNARSRVVPTDVFERMASGLIIPMKEEGFDFVRHIRQEDQERQ